MSFLKEIKSWIGLDPDSITRMDDVSKSNPLFVYTKIPGNLGPVDRGDLFEDPLQDALDMERLGEITGGGSQLSDESGNFVEFCGIDIDLYDAARGLALLRNELMRLQAPPGTMLLYELDGREWEEPVYRRES
jgi:hypothetical protein